MEKGTIYHNMKSYYLSSLYFNEGLETSQKLFTESISKKMLKGVSNDNTDLFYGAIYERSLLHYYQALNFYQIYKQGTLEKHRMIEANPSMDLSSSDKNKEIPEKQLSPNEKQQYLFKARAEIVAWDALISSWKEARKGETVFKNDLLAKILGAEIHETVDTSSDRQIALQLYKDAKEILFKNYNTYPTLNKKASLFQSNYKNFPNLSFGEIETKFVEKTIHQTELASYIDRKILLLTQKIRPEQFEETKKQLKAAPEVITLAVEDFNRLQKGYKPLQVIVEMGMIPPKVADKVSISFNAVLNNIEDKKTRDTVNLYGTMILADFAADVLGLYPSPSNWNTTQAYGGLAVGAALVHTVGINFELPAIKSEISEKRATLVLYDQNNTLVEERPLAIVDPMGDLAQESLREDSSSRYLRTGLRVGGKHLTAILTSFATYKLLANNGTFIAKSAAALQYAGLSKAIEASEKADLRFWSTLPREIRTTNLYVPRGIYRAVLKVVGLNTGKESMIELGSYDLTKESGRDLYVHRIKNI